MNKKEFLLLSLAEEAAEVAQAASKIMKFGEHSFHVTSEGQNIDQLLHEFADLIAVFETYYDHAFPGHRDTEYYSFILNSKIEAKKLKIEQYLKICNELGTVTE